MPVNSSKIAFLSQCKITQVQDRFIGRNQVIPVFDDQLLPVFGAIAVSPDILVEEMRVGNDPGILGDGECVVDNHPFRNLPDFDFPDPRIKGTTCQAFPLGRSLSVLRGNGL